MKSAGFGSVSDFLDKGTDDIAKVLQWKSPEIADEATTQTKKKRYSVCIQGSGSVCLCMHIRSQLKCTILAIVRST